MAAGTIASPSARQKHWQEDVDRGQIDTTVDIVTPENIAFNYKVAGPFRRMPAFFIDLALKMIVLAILAFLFFWIAVLARSSTVGAVLVAVWIVLAFVIQWFYGGLFETYWNGQTPGKWIMGIRVLTVEGQPVNMLQAVMRNVLRIADFLPPMTWNIFQPITTLDPFSGGSDDGFSPTAIPFVMTFMVAFVVMSMNKKYQRLGDLLCGTMVVIEARSWLMGIARLEDPRAAQLAAYLPPNYVVSRSLAKTLATYVERRQHFSLNRRREIARHLAEPLLVRFGLPADTSHDLLLCALYYRTFVADRGTDEGPAGPSPFSQPGPPRHGPPSPGPPPPGVAWSPHPPPPPINIGEIRIRT